MVTQLNRTNLNSKFSAGAHPTGDDFASAWMSFLHQTDDQISYNDKSNNIELGANTGLVLGNPTAGVTVGTLRFNGGGTNTVQFFDGSVFKDIAGNAGAFVQVGTGPAVAFSAGNVGIGTFAAASPPTHRFEIQLAANTGANAAAQEILLGNLVIHNGAANDGAYIGNGNNSLATSPTGYALFQDSSGNTKINASNAANLSLGINDTPRLVITNAGEIKLSPTSKGITINGDTTIGDPIIGHTLTITNITLPNSPATTSSALTLFGDEDVTPGNSHIAALSVRGHAEKSQGGLTWDTFGSDARIKKEIRAYKDGLNKVIQLNPVIYKYNGKGGISDTVGDHVGLIAQDIKKIAPEMIFFKRMKLNPDDEKETELLNYDFHNVLFMFINAFKELNVRIEKLEKQKRNEKRKTGDSPGTDH